MAKPNYEFAKRQRDLLKKQKKEAKKLKKAAAAGSEVAEGEENGAPDGATSAPAEDKPTV